MHYKDRVLQGLNSGVRVQSYNTLSAWNQLQRPEYSDQLHTPSTLLYTTRSSLTPGGIIVTLLVEKGRKA